MYIAKERFISYIRGQIEKGQDIEYNKAWLDAGLIELKPESKQNSRKSTK